MAINFEQVHNYFERIVFEEIARRAPHYPQFNAEMLVDVACVALNRMPVRYVRHEVDLIFYMTEAERQEIERSLEAALAVAFEYVEQWVARRHAESGG